MSGAALPLLRDELPELAGGLEKRLRRQGLDELADSVSEIDGQIAVLSVSHSGILRERLDAMTG